MNYTLVGNIKIRYTMNFPIELHISAFFFLEKYFVISILPHHSMLPLFDGIIYFFQFYFSMARKRAQWTTEQLQQAVDAVRNRGTSLREAARVYKVPRMTISNHLGETNPTRRLGQKIIFTEDEEKQLVERILKYAEVGLPVTRKMLRSYAYDFAVLKGKEGRFNTEKKMAGKDWVCAFLKRNKTLSIRKTQKLNRARAAKVNRFIIGDHFNKLKAVLEEHDLLNDPDKIYNMDEKGVQLTLHHQQSVIAKRGAKRVKMVANEHGENVTVVGCANAVGHAVPPMIIFKGKRKMKYYSVGIPPGSAVEVTAKGSMTSELFIIWLKHFSKSKPRGKVLLIIDGAKCHITPSIIDEAERQDVILYLLPSNTTHETQPMDKSCFSSFEKAWDEAVLIYWKKNPTRSVDKCIFGTLLTEVWTKSMSIKNIVSGFRATGICPFNRDILPDEAYGPSEVTAAMVNEEPQPGTSQDSDVLQVMPDPRAAPTSNTNRRKAVNYKAGILTRKSLREASGKIGLKIKIGELDVVETEVDPKHIK